MCLRTQVCGEEMIMKNTWFDVMAGDIFIHLKLFEQMPLTKSPG